MLFSTMLTLEGLTVDFFLCYPKDFKGFKYRLELCPKNYLKSKHIPGSSTVTTATARPRPWTQEREAKK